MPKTSTEKDTTVRCGNCPVVKSDKIPGLMRDGKWFCSHHCAEEYKRDINEESPNWIP